LRIAGGDAVNAVNVHDSSGRNSLIYAAEYRQYKMAKLLLNKGADVNAQFRHYSNAL
jgi:ankyrin repeat protein